MDFKEEIAAAGKFAEAFSIEFSSMGGYVTGVKSIISFEKDRLVFVVGKNKLVEIKGENLCVKGYIAGDVSFSGIISGAEIKKL